MIQKKMIVSAFFVLALMSLTNATQEQDENVDPMGSQVSGVKRKKDDAFSCNVLVQGKLDNRNVRKKELIEDFKTLKQEAQSCIDKASTEDLNQVFMKLSADNTKMESFYEQECKKNNIIKWPSQATFREAYLGEVFYPQREIDLFYEHDLNEYILQRFDVLWSLAASVKFNNPLALYYLTNGLATHINTVSDCETDVIPNLYGRAFKTLEQVEENDAVYMLRARAYELGWRGGYPFSVEKAFEVYKQSKSKEAQLQMLLMRGKYTADYEAPKRQEYAALSETYPKAYMEIAKEFPNDFDEKVRLLNRACEESYRPALLELGMLYEEADQKEEALKFYDAYGDNGYPEGYFYSSMLYVTDVSFRKDYQKKTDDEIHNAIQALQKAHDLHHPKASYWLGILFLEQHRRNNDPIFESKAVNCFKKAALLGEMSAYEYLDDSQDIINHLFGKINKILGFIGYHSVMGF